MSTLSIKAIAAEARRWLASAEVRALLRAVPTEEARAALLARLDVQADDDLAATPVDFSVETLRTVVHLEATT